MNDPATHADKPTLGSWEAAVQWLRQRPEQRALVEAAYYDDPLLDAAERYWRSEEWADVRRWLPASRGSALDVGAGRGIASFALAKEGYRVVALEPDSSAVVGAQAIRGLARESGLPIEVTQEFSERLPFGDGRFDFVFARAVLHHTRDLRAACAEFLRVLKPGGRFLAVREHVISRREDLPAFLDAHPLHRLYGGENAFLLDEYIDAIQAAGFHLEQVIKPLESAINFAPHTQRSLREEVGARLARRLPGSQSLLRLPGAWPLARAVISRFDDRPGRHYSFVAVRRGVSS